MIDILIARAIHEERQHRSHAQTYRQQWAEYRSLDRLEARLALTKRRLGLLPREAAALRSQPAEQSRGAPLRAGTASGSS